MKCKHSPLLNSFAKNHGRSRYSPPKLGGDAERERSERGGGMVPKPLTSGLRLWNHPTASDCVLAVAPPNLGGEYLLLPSLCAKRALVENHRGARERHADSNQL